MIGGGGWGEDSLRTVSNVSILFRRWSSSAVVVVGAGARAGAPVGLILLGLARPVAPRVLSPSATNRAAMDSTTEAMTVTIQGMPSESHAVHETQRQQFMASVEVVWPS